MGAGPGASLEFHDHRAYVPGDDLRHLDWGALARTDQLLLRRFRVEVFPRIEVVLDASASMAIDARKWRLAATLAALCCTLAAEAGGRFTLWALGQRSERLDLGSVTAWRDRLRALDPNGRDGLAIDPPPRLTSGSDRILISDGLCAAGATHVMQRLGQHAGRLCLLQTVLRREIAPQPLGAVRLVDVEGGERDLIVDDAACAAYRERLARHQSGWDNALAGRGPGLVTCNADDEDGGLIHTLLRAGVVEATA
jgi:uncharacterized protein (DUF58 family)